MNGPGDDAATNGPGHGAATNGPGDDPLAGYTPNWRQQAASSAQVHIPELTQPNGQPQFSYRNSNPGNLRFANQPGATLGDSGFARFSSPAAGYAALVNQIDTDSRHGHTLSSFVAKYAPASDGNDTSGYLERMSTALGGVSGDTPLAQLDHDKLARAVAAHESQTTIAGPSLSSPPPPADPLAGYTPNWRRQPPPKVAPDAASALAYNRPNATGDLQAALANPGQQAKFVGQVAASHALNAAQGIPGMEWAEAEGNSLLTGQPYAQSLGNLRARIERDVGDTPLTTIEQMAATAPLAMLKPLKAVSPAVLGMGLGAADRLAQADPNKGIGQRIGEAAIAAPIGGVIGKAIDLAGATRGALRTPSPQANMLQRQADRAASAAQLFGAAQTEGEMNGANTAVRNFIQEPDIAARIQSLQQMEQYKNLPADSPEMMRALSRSMSDEANTIQKGLAVTDPSKPNTLMDRAKSLGLLKKRLTDVVSNPSVTTKPPMMLDVPAETHTVEPQITPGREPLTGPMQRGTLSDYTQSPQNATLAQALRDMPEASSLRMQGPGGPAFQLAGQPRRVTPGVEISTPAMRVQTAPAQTVTEPAMMPSFRLANQDFAQKSAEMDALRKGMYALQGESSLKRPSPNNIVADNPKTKEAFVDWTQHSGAGGGPVTPGELQAAHEGILGDLSNAWRYEPQGWKAAPFRRAAAKANTLIRATPTPASDATNAGRRLSVLSLNAPFANPGKPALTPALTPLATQQP